MVCFYKGKQGFTLIEVLVVIAIIGILVSVLTVSFSESRKQSRDKVRKSELQSLQLAIELYKSQHGTYPSQGCGTVGSQFAGPGQQTNTSYASCDNYIVGLAPDFIASLPKDPNSENSDNSGFYYRTNTTGTAYKVMISKSVESQFIASFGDEFARCPSQCVTGSVCNSTTPGPQIYALYSVGAECW